MPVCTEKGSVAYSHVIPDTLDFLGIPEREGVIVAMSDKNTIRTDRVQVVPRDLYRGTTVASVVVIPLLGAHEGRDTKATGSDNGGYRGGVPGLYGFGNP